MSLSIEVRQATNTYLTRCHAIQLTDTSDSLYRVRLTTEHENSAKTRETYARRIPDWLFCETLDPTSKGVLTLYKKREHGWHDMGTRSFDHRTTQPLEFEGTLLQLSFQTASLQALPSHVFSQVCWPSATNHSQDLMQIPALVEPLNRQDAVHLRNLWQKWQTEKDYCQHLCASRWHHLTNLKASFGDRFDLLPAKIHALFGAALQAACPSGPDQAYTASLAFFANSYVDRTTLEFLGEAFLWALHRMPNLDSLDRTGLAKKDGAAQRFFHNFILVPILESQARQQTARRLIADEIAPLWYRARTQNPDQAFFQAMIQSGTSNLVTLFKTEDPAILDHLLFGILDFSFELARDWRGLSDDFQRIAKLHARLGIPGDAIHQLKDPLDLVTSNLFHLTPPQHEALALHFEQILSLMTATQDRNEMVHREAMALSQIFAEELPDHVLESNQYQAIAQGGSYQQSFAQLEHGARLAWRNAARCIGRLYWNTLKVQDCRQLTTPKDVFEAILTHLNTATNGGKLQSTISVFRPKRPNEPFGPRIWNAQLIRYACYRQGDGSLLGDPASLQLTQAIQKLGWKPPALLGPFDVLPLVIEVPGHEPQIFEIPDDLVLQVPLHHPRHACFSELNLRWYAVPAIANFTLEIGGISYPAAPFNGWYMGTEIARNLSDQNRYNRLSQIASKLGLETRGDRSLWRDEALLVLNQAILHSFNEAGVTLANHHAASRQYMAHDQREKLAGREVPGDWAWLQPPMGGSICPIYHHVTHQFDSRPAYYQTPDPWLIRDGDDS